MTSERDGNGNGASIERSDALAAEEEARKKEQTIADRLGTLMRFISGRWNLTVTTTVPDAVRQACLEKGTDPEENWYRWTEYEGGALTGELVHVPLHDLKNITAAKGKAAHEAAHVRIGRWKMFVPQSVVEELGFTAAIQAVEERPTDACVRKLFPGAGEWLDHVRRLQIEKANAQRMTTGSHASLPKFLQLCNLIVYEPHLSRRAIRQQYDPDIVALYESIRDAVERVEQTLPAKHATEEEVVEAAKERYQIMYADIWPAVRLLAEQDATREAIRRMLDMEGMEGLLQELSKKLQRELGVKTGAGTIPEEDAAGGTSDDPGGPAEGESGDPAEAAGDPPDPGEEDESAGEEDAHDVGVEATEQGRDESDDQAEAEGEPERGSGSDAADAHVPSSLDDCPPELLEALRGHFEEIPPEQREALLAQAKARLAMLEASIVDSIRSILSIVMEHVSTAGSAGQEPMESEPSEARRSPKEISAVRLRTKTPYDKAHEQVRNQEDELYGRFLPLFRPRVAEETGLKNAGNTADLRAVFRRASAKAAGSTAVDHRIYRFPIYPTVPDDAHAVLLDLSGSMGKKIKLAFPAVVLYAEVLSRLRVPFEMLGFQDELIVFKEADETLNEAVRQRMSGMLLEPSNGNPGGWNHASYNDDGPCLLKASKRLEAMRGKRKFLHVFSDGLPAGRYSNANDLRKAVAHIRSGGLQALIGYGMGPGTEHVGHFYPVSLPNIPLEHLVGQAGDLLADIVYHPGKYNINFR